MNSTRRRRTARALAATCALTAVLAAPAQADQTYCSPSGDICQEVDKRGSDALLQIRAAAQYFSSYRLCVVPPRGARECKVFRLRERDDGIFSSSVRWSRHFTNRGRGTYRVTWRAGGSQIGRRLSFRR